MGKDTRASITDLAGMNIEAKAMIEACTRKVYGYARVSTEG